MLPDATLPVPASLLGLLSCVSRSYRSHDKLNRRAGARASRTISAQLGEPDAQMLRWCRDSAL
jgi:hypothetical protein